MINNDHRWIQLDSRLPVIVIAFHGSESRVFGVECDEVCGLKVAEQLRVDLIKVVAGDFTHGREDKTCKVQDDRE